MVNRREVRDINFFFWLSSPAIVGYQVIRYVTSKLLVKLGLFQNNRLLGLFLANG